MSHTYKCTFVTNDLHAEGQTCLAEVFASSYAQAVEKLTKYYSVDSIIDLTRLGDDFNDLQDEYLEISGEMLYTESVDNPRYAELETELSLVSQAMDNITAPRGHWKRIVLPEDNDNAFQAPCKRIL